MGRGFESRPAYAEVAGQKRARLNTIQGTIDAWAISDDLKTELKKRSEELLDSHRVTTTNRYYGGQIGTLAWVIKNDDLKLLEQLTPAAMAMITFLSVASAPVPVLVAGLAFSVLGVCNKLRSKGIVLNPADFHILMALKHVGPSTPSRIAEVLSGLHIYGRDVWDETRVVAVLNKLKLRPQNDGTAVTIVNESSDGRWSVAGM